MSDNELMTPAEVARALRVSMRHVQRMRESGALAHITLGPKTVRYYRGDIDDMLLREDICKDDN
jgi:excisionase family DNA binding protein